MVSLMARKVNCETDERSGLVSSSAIFGADFGNSSLLFLGMILEFLVEGR